MLRPAKLLLLIFCLQGAMNASGEEPLHKAQAVGPSDHKGMVLIPAGEFDMGSDTGKDNERPKHRVHLNDYWIDETEVTINAYAACVEAKKCKIPKTHQLVPDECNWGKPDRGQHPINCIDWKQANAYCTWNQKRLPTEAEWEKAARGGDDRKYPWGNQPLIKELLDIRYSPYTHPVKSTKTDVNPFGVFGMGTNVEEWTADWYKSYDSDDDQDIKTEFWRSVRGGGIGGNYPKSNRIEKRNAYRPNSSTPSIGFRCSK